MQGNRQEKSTKGALLREIKASDTRITRQGLKGKKKMRFFICVPQPTCFEEECRKIDKKNLQRFIGILCNQLFLLSFSSYPDAISTADNNWLNPDCTRLHQEHQEFHSFSLSSKLGNVII
ncbi:uncharacterized protein LOC132606541 [Lycium barbarum]|uniref:uncharacterized protein LOC132606541 n=1 Tax=Lycium barbarum TaxID=112863 RepID=UPI00293F03D0|nr:uncharacterized protein LOC132606541 [Lycium barbarum]XP_060176089.1 uncharacterized protein LOC132606541 [Lycium barbarum]